jgi:6-phosphogluconolactonase/glucosamine-6-phosphate isomerase/deaminase
MSFTYPLLSRTRKIRFLVRGADKERIVRRLAADDPALPAARIEAADQAILYCSSSSL